MPSLAYHPLHAVNPLPAAGGWLALLGCLEATAGTAPVEPARLADRVWDCELRSKALGRRTRYVVFLPASYPAAAGTRIPVVLLLHGAGRHRKSLFEAPKARDLLLSAPFATVMPDGGGGWWADSPVRASARFHGMIGEVLADAEHRFAIGGERRLRALTGWSMGGFGCVRYAQSVPGEFCALAPMIGLLDFPNPALPPEQNHSVPAILGPEPESFNPMRQADRLRGLDILLVTGDRAFDYTMNRSFHARLDELGIGHTYTVLPGQGHTFNCVELCLEHVVTFLSGVFARPHK